MRLLLVRPSILPWSWSWRRAARPLRGPDTVRWTCPEHAKQYKRLLIRHAMIVYGNAKPPYVRWTSCSRTLIARIGNSRAGARSWPAATPRSTRRAST